jgi:hypothetical protein
MGSITTAKTRKELQGEAIQTCGVSFNAYGLWPCVEEGRGRGGREMDDCEGSRYCEKHANAISFIQLYIVRLFVGLIVCCYCQGR